MRLELLSVTNSKGTRLVIQKEVDGNEKFYLLKVRQETDVGHYEQVGEFTDLQKMVYNFTLQSVELLREAMDGDQAVGSDPGGIRHGC